MNLLDILFPKRCVGCGKLGRYFCLDCQKTIRFIAFNESICPVCEKLAIDGVTHPACRTKYSPDGLTSFFHYDGVIRKAVKALKYRFVSDLASEFISLVPNPWHELKRIPGQARNDNIVLLPIPLHPARLRERGFNQAEVLANILSPRLNMAVRHDILKRVKKTAPQVDMKNRKDRLKNMDSVFAINNGTMEQFSNVILFDDVFTTGATMRAAANVLKRAGVTQVWAVTMAR